MTRKADWYFDFVSPFAYLQFQQFDRLPDDLRVTLRPVLFAGLLDHWGQLGPAEIPAKKQSTFLLAQWRARQHGIPFRPPPRHPFNPLVLLRLAIALGSGHAVVRTIFEHVWQQGEDGQSEDSLRVLAKTLGLRQAERLVQTPQVKASLRENTERAAAAGVFGVPTFVIGDRLFWGDDSFGLMLDWLKDPAVLESDEAKRIAALEPAATRPGAKPSRSD